MKQRTFRFAANVIRAVKTMPQDPTSGILSRQLVKCSTSVGANYRAACRARSGAEFVAKQAIAEEECDESICWMALIEETGAPELFTKFGLISEGEEILRIIVASIRTARKNL